MKFHKSIPDEIYLTYDDVLLVPKYSEIKTRKDIDISSGILGLKTPIISANMDTITEENMAIAMHNSGGIGIIHRFLSDIRLKQIISRVCLAGATPIVSIGIGDDSHTVLEMAIKKSINHFCIDIAHGHHSGALEMIKSIRALTKLSKSKVIIIAGNVSTPDGAYYLAQAGADIIKVGQGPGCFAAGTRILMSNGTYKNIESIVVGDRVINKNGLPVNVISTKFSGFRKIEKYSNSNHWQDSLVTHDHMHFVKKNDTSKYGWEKTSELNNIFLLAPRYISFSDMLETFELSMEDFGYSRNTITPSYELGYIFGTFLGGGTASIHKTCKVGTNGHVTWGFGCKEFKIAVKLCSFLKSIFSINTNIKKKKNKIVVIVNCKPLAHLLEEFGKKNNKHLPNKYFANNKDYLRGILNGLSDGDGHITSIRLIELYSICHYILHGYFPGVCKKEISKDLNSFNQRFFIKPYINPKNCLTKNYQLVSNSRFQVKDINIILPTYDIEVDCETHSFTANNAIVHNSCCTTRLVTGHGIPQLTAILSIKTMLLEHPEFNHVEIIADGGIRNSGDIAKAIASGADYVMIGKMFAGTDECPGDYFYKDGKKFKFYRGMASLSAQQSMGKTAAPEGVSTNVLAIGPVGPIIKNLGDGLRSACSYSGAKNLKEFRENAQFVRVTHNSYIEGTTYGGI